VRFKGLRRTLERTSQSLPAAGKELAYDGSRSLLPTLAGGMDAPLEIEQRAARRGWRVLGAARGRLVQGGGDGAGLCLVDTEEGRHA
jgi:hypothetical protein